MDANEIKYMALAELGYTEEPDFSSDEDNGVNIINRVYPTTYSLALQSYEWSFSQERVSISGESSTGKHGYKFILPDDLIYLRSIYCDENYTTPLNSYERNGDEVYADEPTIYIVYVKKVCENTLPAYFIDYFVYKLARKCCTKITGNKDLLAEMMQSEQMAYSVAKNTDIKQQEVRILPTGAFTDVRN